MVERECDDRVTTGLQDDGAGAHKAVHCAPRDRHRAPEPVVRLLGHSEEHRQAEVHLL